MNLSCLFWAVWDPTRYPHLDEHLDANPTMGCAVSQPKGDAVLPSAPIGTAVGIFAQPSGPTGIKASEVTPNVPFMARKASRLISMDSQALVVPELPATDPVRYRDPDSVWCELRKRRVHPLRLSWLLQQRSHWGKPPKLSQFAHLPEAALIGVDELKALFGDGNDTGNGDVLPIIAVSAQRFSPDHLDPEGLQLRHLVDFLQVEKDRYAQSGYTEMGIIWPHASFSDSEAYAETMDLWFGHSAITAILLDRLPASASTTIGYTLCWPDHDERAPTLTGWSTFERLAAEQTQKWHAFNVHWELVNDLTTVDPTSASASAGSLLPCYSSGRSTEAVSAEAAAGDGSDFDSATGHVGSALVRNWPVGPDDFATLAPSLQFESDKERVLTVCLYDKCASSCQVSLSLTTTQTPSHQNMGSRVPCSQS